MIRFFRKKANNNGSSTVEAAIVIPVIILSIAAAIYLGLLLYQRSLLQSAADRAAEAGAAAWENRAADTGSGKIEINNLGNEGLYWRVFDTTREDKLEKIKRYALAISGKSNILKPVSSDFKVEIRDYVIYKRLEITVKNSYSIPAGRLLGIFGANDRFTINIKSTAIIDDPAELIRNTDFIIDIEKELEDKYPGVKDLAEKTRTVVGDLKGKINGFLD